MPSLEALAHHEAGHAVAAIINRVRIKHVSIRATDWAAGHLRLRGSARNIDGIHRRGITALAGPAAQRRFKPQSVRSYHASQDWRDCVTYALDCTGSSEQASLMVKLWHIQARDCVALHWGAIQRIAIALMNEGELDESKVWELVINRPLNNSAEVGL